MTDTSKRGFASMDAQKQREIASKGGKAAHAKGTAHEFTPEEAREAGRKGGEAVSKDREHMAEIGREGGKSSRKSNRDENKSKEEDKNANGSSHKQPAKTERQS
ncbi:MAG: stress-induced protein [Hydrococcus sp. C42_A2020_068]|uniref:KGG domain-containing protein n=1 Tax=Pleurocapsa sp. PCC 7327 TaxID=118163 RepID=UPI00029FFF7A|nr:KGG domain-containing protein [Pleurocapsa sp. PCC 7327]AFY78207.1 stress-induced acidophilic repeat motif-containing protein [Pleurocapsa sp. PCC 7327]MBF2020007.1 stress-induced protein [Hydrococcus sp. C42_A2020_068]